MDRMHLFWQIVPLNDGCYYLYKDKDGYRLHHKANDARDNDLLLFKTEEEANAYIEKHFTPRTYKAEWIAIGVNRYEEWRRENGIVPNADCGECPVYLADEEGEEACAECPLRKEYLARFN